MSRGYSKQWKFDFDHIVELLSSKWFKILLFERNNNKSMYSIIVPFRNMFDWYLFDKTEQYSVKIFLYYENKV